MNHQYSSSPFGSPATPPPLVALASVLGLVVLDLALIRYCLDDLNWRVIVLGGDKVLWAAVIILGGLVGQMIYWLCGRRDY